MKALRKIMLLILFLVLLGGCNGGGGGVDTVSDGDGSGSTTTGTGGDDGGDTNTDTGGDDGGGSTNTGGGSNPPASTDEAVVLAANDLGMHCMDREFSVFSILPPFNVVNAQILKRDSNGLPYIADDVEVNVFYDSIADPSGSINTYSIGKTDFWQYANSLFGTSLQEGEGLTGLYMPDDDPQMRGPQPMEYNLQNDWFSAEGIPITPIDDSMNINTYSLMRISALDTQGTATLGYSDIVVPVATETDCQNCHKTGGIAAQGSGWSNDPDLEVQSKKNILILHDRNPSANTDLVNQQPVLCAGCHYSRALDLAGTGPAGDQIGVPDFSTVMHKYHGEIDGGQLFPDSAPIADTCYQCHPGSVTQCLRGAMKNGGMDCTDCHGGMLAVGGNRDPWLDLPECQSCHTGDAVSYLTGPNLVNDPAWPFRKKQAYLTGDASASPLTAPNDRFAENPNTLYRFSKGHGGVFCEGCHGSTHAIWPNADASANDNITATNLQGYSGKIIECNTCHKPGTLSRTTQGPHGLHNVNDARWYDEGHESYYESNKNACKACHGQDLTGTALSKVPTVRSFSVEDGNVSFQKGDLVGCNHCHRMPSL